MSVISGYGHSRNIRELKAKGRFTLSKFLWSQYEFCIGTVNSKFWRICTKCLRELTQCKTTSQFPKKFLTNPSKLRIYPCKIPTVITETSIVYSFLLLQYEPRLIIEHSDIWILVKLTLWTRLPSRNRTQELSHLSSL